MTGGTSRIAELSRSISEGTAILDSYINDNGLQPFAFDESGASQNAALPPHIEAAKLSVMDAANELRELIGGPHRLLQGIANHDAFDFVVRKKVWEHVDGDGASYKTLSGKTGVNEFALKRVLRALMAQRLFVEHNGIVKHSAASKVISNDPMLAQTLVDTVEEMKVRPIGFLGRALELFPEAQELDECAASLAYTPADVQQKALNGNEKDSKLWTFYQYIGASPERTLQFGRTMALAESQPGYSLQYLVEGFDWAGLPGGGTVIDVGGSHGETAFALAKKAPQLRFIVQDRKEVIESLPSITRKDGEGNIPANVEFMAHDFFDPQPIRGAKVILLRRILHNWPDKYAIRILKALVPALESGTRVLVMDAISPKYGEATSLMEREIRKMDLTMLALFNAGEREADHWPELFASADQRFLFKGITTPAGSALSLIEAMWEDRC